MSSSNNILSSGKRKTAIARAAIKPGKGKILINHVPLELITPYLARMKMMEPLLFLDEKTRNSFDISIRVHGGGYMGQADAVRIAIARGIVEFTNNKAIREAYLTYDRHMITGDPRRAEPKKFGGKGARSRYTKSYR